MGWPAQVRRSSRWGVAAAFGLLGVGFLGVAPGPTRGSTPVFAEDADEPEPPDSKGGLSEADAKKARAELDEAIAVQEKREYLRARKQFRAWLERYPAAPSAWREEATDRSEENCFLGYELIHAGGPPENRIDVELMGDGYKLEQQDTFRKQAEDQLKEFWREPLYDEYGSYFNVYRFDLASKDEGVDEVAAPEPPPGSITRPSKKKRPLKEYSTALNCQAAGPQRQVWADPDMVFRWRKYLKASDGLSLCFAKKGELGMGGMGIATTGRRVAVVHEFGHAFIGLLDEYANHPGPPPGHVAARNAISGRGDKEPPELKNIPWKHWLDAKNPEVDVLLGGATYQLGVFRPAATCAMNSGGSSPYCWVCREAGVLKIYEYVNPIDEAGPAERTLTMARGEAKEFYVVPMQPKSHKLLVDWWLEKVKSRTTTHDDDEDEPAPAAEPPPDDAPLPRLKLTPDGRSEGGPHRGRERHNDPWAPGPPRGDEQEAKEKIVKGPSGERVTRSSVTLSGLTIGRYRLTVRVRDDTVIPNAKYPWVLKDPDKILEERRTWLVEVK